MPEPTRRKILVATDLLPRSAGTLATGAALARAQGAGLVVLHVIGFSDELGQAGALEERSLRKLIQRASKAALVRLTHQVRAHSRGISSVRCLVKVGRPGRVVCDTAKKLGAGWIVVGRGEEGSLGSTAERVVRARGHTVVVVPVGRASRAASFGAPPPAEESATRRRPSIAPVRPARRGRTPAALSG